MKKIGLVILLVIVCFSVIVIGIGMLSAVVGVSGGSKVALINIDGVILTQTQSTVFGSEGTSSTFVVNQLNDIKEDPSVVGVILQINSPGGSGVASKEIADAITALDKPVVSYIREGGASGAYWIASATDYIYASPLSTVGSIGVISSYLDFSEFIEDYNISYQRFVAGDNKDFGSPFRTPTLQEEQRYQTLLDSLHIMFIRAVAQGRNVPYEQIEALADGFIYSGEQALENGLIDGYGGQDEAIAFIEEQVNQSVYLVNYEPVVSFWDALAGYTAPAIRTPLDLVLSQEHPQHVIMT